MRKKRNIHFATIILAIFTLVAGYFLGKTSASKVELSRTDTVTVFKHDTIIQTEPQEVVRYVYRTKTDTLQTIDSIYVAVQIPMETVEYTDTVCDVMDTIFYNAYISGYQPKLDSLRFYHNKYERTIIQTYRPPVKKWHWGITGGYFVGYDISHGQVSNGLGVCVGCCYTFQ